MTTIHRSERADEDHDNAVDNSCPNMIVFSVYVILPTYRRVNC